MSKLSEKARIILIASLLAVSFARVALAQKVVSKSPAGEKATILEQQGKLAGKQTIYISADGIRIDNKQQNLVTIASPPDWKIFLYNPSAKLYYETVFAHYRGMMSHLFLFYGIDASAYDFEFVRKDSVLGHPCSVLKPTGRKGSSAEDQEMAKAGKSFWVADSITIAKPAADILAKQLCLPASNKVPVRMDFMTDKTLAHGLETVQWTNSSLPKSWFTLPAGFKKVTRESEVTVRDDSL